MWNFDNVGKTDMVLILQIRSRGVAFHYVSFVVFVLFLRLLL